MTTIVMRMKRKKMMKIAAWRCHALSAISASRADFLNETNLKKKLFRIKNLAAKTARSVEKPRKAVPDMTLPR